MNELDQWLYLDGPPPTSVGPLLEALRAPASPRPRAEDKARVIADFFATLDARIAQAEGNGEDEIEAAVATNASEAPQRFEEWAALSLRLLGAGEDETHAALTARGFTPASWAELDEACLELLSDDLLSEHSERQAFYAARCDEEMARRAEEDDAEEEGNEGEGDEDEAAPTPAMPRAPSTLVGTAEALDIPAALRAQMAVMPFKEEPPAAVELKRATPKTLQGARMRSSVRETLPLGDDSVDKNLAMLPFALAPVADVVVLFPRLTAHQYLSLRAELVLRPDLRADLLRRYGVPHEVAMRALEAHWKEQLASQPALRAEYEAAIAAFAALLRG